MLSNDAEQEHVGYKLYISHSMGHVPRCMHAASCTLFRMRAEHMLSTWCTPATVFNWVKICNYQIEAEAPSQYHTVYEKLEAPNAGGPQDADKTLPDLASSVPTGLKNPAMSQSAPIRERPFCGNRQHTSRRWSRQDGLPGCVARSRQAPFKCRDMQAPSSWTTPCRTPATTQQRQLAAQAACRRSARRRPGARRTPFPAACAACHAQG